MMSSNVQGVEAGCAAMLRGSQAFGGVNEQRLQALARASRRRVIERGGALFRAGEQAEQVTIVVSGLVKVVRFQPDATEGILGLFGPREGVGLIAVLQRKPYPATALAMTERVEVLTVRAADVLEAMQQDTALALALNRALLYQAKILHEKIDVMSAGSVTQRLSSLLLTLAERFGDRADDGVLRLPVVLSRGELSSLIGARVETTIRVLSRWQKQGILETTREGFELHDEASLEAARRGKGQQDD